MRNNANTESERKTLNKEILELTKALTVMRNNKIEWHSRLKMDVSQLCGRRYDEIYVKQILLDEEYRKRRVRKLRKELANQRLSKIAASRMLLLMLPLIQVLLYSRYHHPLFTRKKPCNKLSPW